MTSSDLNELPAIRPRVDLGDIEPRSRDQFARLIRQLSFKDAKYRLQGVR